jgi:hypothetical protein
MRSPKAPFTPQDSLTICEFADLFGLPPTAILSAIERQRSLLNKPFYSIQDLADRWRCSRATVYAVLAESEFKVLNLARKGKDKGKKLIPRPIVEKLEESRMGALTETAA